LLHSCNTVARGGPTNLVGHVLITAKVLILGLFSSSILKTSVSLIIEQIQRIGKFRSSDIYFLGFKEKIFVELLLKVSK